MSNVQVGDHVRDCDPRSGAVKTVTDIMGAYAFVAPLGSLHKTRVRLDRIHDRAEAKKGYFNLTHASRREKAAL